MNPESILKVIDTLLCVGIIFSIIGAGYCKKSSAHFLTPALIFCGQIFVTVFLAFRAAGYAQAQNALGFGLMILGACGGAAPLIFAFIKALKNKNQSNHPVRPTPPSAGGIVSELKR